MSQTRRLAAILAADVAGYSRLIRADEGVTLQSLKARQPRLTAHAPALFGLNVSYARQEAGRMPQIGLF
jgi:class 3 adenylate cyclase